jgi:acyl transferase domain-containing protein
VLDNDAKFAWCFTGMGPQWVDMGRELWASNSVFRSACEAVDSHFLEVSGGSWSPLVEFNSPDLASRISRNDVAQPLNFMLQVGSICV